jgi:outer membrane protein assembly factor BamB
VTLRLATLGCLLIACALQAAENWPQFRGPSGDGHSDAVGLPAERSETQNVKWKTAIHGKAWSSPVIWGDQIWLSTATEDGKQLFAVCVDKNTGKILHDIKLRDVADPQFCHEFNSFASGTGVIEDGRVWLHFGSPGTFCLDTRTGKKIWERLDFSCNHYRGPGSSLLLDGGKLLMHFDGSDLQYVVAVDKNTGKTIWQTDRSVDFKDLNPKTGLPDREGDWRKCYATPRIIEHDGRRTLVSIGSKAVYGYDPESGKELWRVEETNSHSAGGAPLFGHGLIYAPISSRGLLRAIRPGGSGDVTATHVAFEVTRNVPSRSSPLLIGDLLFMNDSSGIASCLEAATGKEIWKQRIGGTYSASPLYADGKIHFFDEFGQVTIIKPARQFQQIAQFKMGDGFMASPAVSGKALYLRTRTHLYRVEQ